MKRIENFDFVFHMAERSVPRNYRKKKNSCQTSLSKQLIILRFAQNPNRNHSENHLSLVVGIVRLADAGGSAHEPVAAHNRSLFYGFIPLQERVKDFPPVCMYLSFFPFFFSFLQLNA